MILPTSGSYILAKPLDNPEADGRANKQDWAKAKQLPSGRYFVNVLTSKEEVAGVTLTRSTVLISRHGCSRGYHLSGSLLNGEPTRDNAAAALLAALQKDDTMAGRLCYSEAEHYTEMFDVLLQLVDNGDVSRTQVDAALRVVEARDAEEED